MTLYSILFYLLAALIVVSTGLAVTRRNLVHAVIYLVISFFGSAMLFYLLGAPLLAMLEIIIYAGAIMILFLFIIMMLKVDGLREQVSPAGQWLPAAVLGGLFAVVGLVLVFTDPESGRSLKAATVPAAMFGQHLFSKHWLAIEIASLLLLIPLVGVLYLGRNEGRNRKKDLAAKGQNR